MIFQRLPGFDEFHGPERFSLLFICADGVATYLDLYVGNRVVPLVLAIIQPGTGFGGNYTDFRDPNGLLAHVVLKMNNGRVPDYMVCGQIGPLDQTHAFWQMEYPEHVEYFQHRNGVGVWRRWELTQSDDL